VLRAESDPGSREPNPREPDFPQTDQDSTNQLTKRKPAKAAPASLVALRGARLAIASRLLEGAGATLAFAGNADADRTSAAPARFRSSYRALLPSFACTTSA
jgi:hypothetical protein